MGKPATFTLNWGIISAGGISTCFAQDLVDAATPTLRMSTTNLLLSTPALSSLLKRSMTNSEKLRGNRGLEKHPHVLHHRNAKDALWAGKHVLENPACLEVEELDELIKIAMRISRFFMDNDAELCGLGSSLSPNAVEEVIKSGILAKPRRFSADSSMDVNLDGTLLISA
ncbi:hypothetical protein D1P53_001028 [Cryptococcus gattii VGV]|nr:hypothetical protein D1P53_001028 [Cryptococcus gattii VGV]